MLKHEKSVAFTMIHQHINIETEGEECYQTQFRVWWADMTQAPESSFSQIQNIQKLNLMWLDWDGNR